MFRDLFNSILMKLAISAFDLILSEREYFSIHESIESWKPRLSLLRPSLFDGHHAIEGKSSVLCDIVNNLFKLLGEYALGLIYNNKG